MKVVKHTISENKKELVEYPAIWGNKIKGLDENISFYEIKKGEIPTYNPMQYDVKKTYELTDIQGEFLPIANEILTVSEKTQAEVIQFLNTSVGKHIDNNYPLWEQNKHSGKALRAINQMLTGGILTESEQQYISYVQACADWAAECRQLRDEYEHIYLTEGVLPQVVWLERPKKS